MASFHLVIWGSGVDEGAASTLATVGDNMDEVTDDMVDEVAEGYGDRQWQSNGYMELALACQRNTRETPVRRKSDGVPP